LDQLGEIIKELDNNKPFSVVKCVVVNHNV